MAPSPTMKASTLIQRATATPAIEIERPAHQVGKAPLQALRPRESESEGSIGAPTAGKSGSG